MLTDNHGRPLDDLDIARFRASVVAQVGVSRSYSVESSDGAPICGFVAADAEAGARFVAMGFKQEDKGKD